MTSATHRPAPTLPRAARPTWPRALALAAAFALPALAASAASLTVRVESADGQPAANVVVQVLPPAPWASKPMAEPVVVQQKDIRFVPWVTAVPVGSTVRFTNLDRFDHHLRSQPGGPLGTVPPAKEFEFRLAGNKGGPVSSADVKLDVPGTIVLGCHLHNSMRGHLFVSSSPWVAVTDAQGRATLADLPEGEATVKLWHPERLVEQADQKATVRAGAAPLAATLNFTPKRRPAAAPAEHRPSAGATSPYGY